MMYTINPELIEWMSNHGLHGYDGLTTLSEGQLNATLAEQHRRRLSCEKVLTNITGTLPIKDTNTTYSLAGYQMSAPALELSSLNKFGITSQLDSGLLVEHTSSSPVSIRAVSQHDALDPMEQTCDLPLLPTLEQSLLELDVANGERMLLGVGDGPVLHQHGGKFIQQYMQDHAERNEPYVLASLGRDADNALAIKQIDLQTQEDAETGHRDLLLWAATQQGKVGKLPSDVHVPGLDPAVNTVLASARLVHRVSYGRGLTGLLEGGTFEEQRDSENMLVGLRATAGHLTVPASRYTSTGYSFECDAFTVPASDGLSVTFEADEVNQAWKSQCTVALRYKPLGGKETEECQATFDLDLGHRFTLLKASEQQKGVLQGQLYSPWERDAQVVATRGLPQLSDDERAQIEEFIAHVVKRAIVTGLSKNLAADAPERWLANTQVGLDTDVFLRAADVAGKTDVAMITTPTEFTIEPSTAVVLAGESCELRIVPPRENVYWYVERLPVSAEDAGEMYPEYGPTSTYWAALPDALKGKPSKALVIAADVSRTTVLASALVTTVSRAVTVNPMIHACDGGDELLLTAGSLGGGELDWKILDPVESKSGSLVPEEGGKRCRYEAKAVEGTTYFIERIQVEDRKTKDRCTVHVLGLPSSKSNVVVQLKAPPGEDGSFELVGERYGTELEEAQWWLPIDGQGRFVDGRYVPPEANEAGFVLIFVKGFDGNRTVEGHLILPWPLTDFPELIEKLTAR